MKKLFAALLVMFGLTTAAAACPTISPGAQQYSATGDQLFQPRAFDVVAGGDRDLAGCPHIFNNLGSDRLQYSGTFFTGQPDFSFQLSGMQRYRLDIRVVSECDAALLINTGSVNWFFDDDDLGNLDPRITLTRPSNGRLDIWVGALNGPCNAQLQLETFRR